MQALIGCIGFLFYGCRHGKSLHREWRALRGEANFKDVPARVQFVLQDFAVRVFESVSGIDRLTGRVMHGEQARCESVLLLHRLAGVI